MHVKILFLNFLVLCLAITGASLPNPALAAGSGGGSDDSYSSNSRGLSPAQRSGKEFRAGLKHRDRALNFETKAAKAKSEKSRDKLLAKAHKEFIKAVDKQGEAVRLYPQNYKAANELGFALRKTGDYRKAIGAYNYALEINPNFHAATEYRAEAFLALGLLDQTKNAYMQLFRNDRGLAAQLMERFDEWLTAKDKMNAAEAEFAAWIAERKRIAKITDDLSMRSTRTW
jgi:tetratricopeptide (TPR) repeat protein